DVLARIHNVDYRAVGLSDYGREGQYIQRQLARWSSQYDLSRTEQIDSMEALKQWLPANIPPGDETRINHGDYRLGNTIVHPTHHGATQAGNTHRPPGGARILPLPRRGPRPARPPAARSPLHLHDVLFGGGLRRLGRLGGRRPQGVRPPARARVSRGLRPPHRP